MHIEFHTFDEMVSVLSCNTPCALVLDWWSRLERAIRRFTNQVQGSIATLISDDLGSHPDITPELINELHHLRRRRNCVAHDASPSLTAQEAETYARKAWGIACFIGELSSTRRVSPNIVVERGSEAVPPSCSADNSK